MDHAPIFSLGSLLFTLCTAPPSMAIDGVWADDQIINKPATRCDLSDPTRPLGLWH